jgi:hypothetical protein
VRLWDAFQGRGTIYQSAWSWETGCWARWGRGISAAHQVEEGGEQLPEDKPLRGCLCGHVD